MSFDLELIGRLLLASLLGGAIGLEREVHGRPAGFRTHLLVSLGSALFVVSSLKFYFLYGNVSGSGPIGVDPARIAAQVVTGIGFLGAGAIIREGTSVRGLTTAACLWVVAAIGVAAAAGLYLISSVVTVIALVSLLVLKRVETMISRDVYTSVKIWSDDIAGQMARIEEIISSCRMSVMNVSMERDMQKGEIFLTYEVRFNDRLKPCSVMDSIFTASGVRRVRLD